MRAIIQRVSEATVKINGEIKSSIGLGLLILLGIEEADTIEDINWLSAKIVSLRIFNDDNGVMNISVKDKNGDVILVSQFTLHASTKKGNRPSYIKAAKPEIAIPLYKKMILQYKTSPLTRLAYLDLASIYLQLATSGDGDGSKLREARINLKEYVEKFPISPEIKWAKNMLKKTYEMEASRLYNLALYYYKNGNENASKRYIKEILVNYPDTKVVKKADELLDIIEMPLYPKDKLPTPEDTTKYTAEIMKATDDRIMVIPENSGNKWLVPLKETGIDNDNLTKEKYINNL